MGSVLLASRCGAFSLRRNVRQMAGADKLRIPGYEGSRMIAWIGWGQRAQDEKERWVQEDFELFIIIHLDVECVGAVVPF